MWVCIPPPLAISMGEKNDYRHGFKGAKISGKPPAHDVLLAGVCISRHLSLPYRPQAEVLTPGELCHHSKHGLWPRIHPHPNPRYLCWCCYPCLQPWLHLSRGSGIYSGWWRFIIHYWCYIYGMFDYQEKSLNYPHRWNWWAFKPNVETILVAIVRAPWPGTAVKRLKSTSLEKTKAPSCALIDHQPISTPKKLEFLLENENHGEY